MEFVRVRLTDPRVDPLLTDLRREYDARYGDGDSVLDAPAEAFDPPAGCFVVLLEEGRTVAGGGIRRLDAGTCEVKRMWTSPDYRRRGLASAMLAELESVARELGYATVRLETGPAQPEALALYRRLGYREIGNYGQYENATGFERRLAGEDA
ncbi:GNAT family N-acetyltransferase [Cryobacterium tagatosivorans]|uniref:GNAT family N-acetyltransferase n=1 Tax=Cryobacterium tagatosivorans TaxID=1259199 RepID=UPI00141BD8F8|nr:GNAT family N-acetyltransferase [Cryobacterium tagatosivorans]